MKTVITMKTIIVSGRRIEIPDAPTTPEEISHAAGVRPGRRIIRRTREGNYPLNPGERILPGEDETFVDAPQRVKGYSPLLGFSHQSIVQKSM